MLPDVSGWLLNEVWLYSIPEIWNLFIEVCFCKSLLLSFSTYIFQCLFIILVFPKIMGAPKSSILIGFSIINHPFWGNPIFGNTHISLFFKDILAFRVQISFSWEISFATKVGVHRHPSWRIIPGLGGPWLMVPWWSFSSPKDRVVGPLPNHRMAYKWGWS